MSFRVSPEVKEAFENFQRIKLLQQMILLLKREVYYLRIKYGEPETCESFPTDWEITMAPLQYESMFSENEKGKWKKRKHPLNFDQPVKKKAKTEETEETEYSESE